MSPALRRLDAVGIACPHRTEAWTPKRAMSNEAYLWNTEARFNVGGGSKVFRARPSTLRCFRGAAAQCVPQGYFDSDWAVKLAPTRFWQCQTDVQLVAPVRSSTASEYSGSGVSALQLSCGRVLADSGKRRGQTGGVPRRRRELPGMPGHTGEQKHPQAKPGYALMKQSTASTTWVFIDAGFQM